MINLDNLYIIQKFQNKNSFFLRDREVYIDLKNKKCIKLPRNKYSFIFSDREKKFYNNLDNKYKKYFAEPYGIIETNKGKAYYYELILNKSDEVAYDIEKYINKYGKSILLYEKFIDLVNFICNNNITFLRSKDIVVSLENNIISSLVIIDYESILKLSIPKGLNKFFNNIKNPSKILNPYPKVLNPSGSTMPLNKKEWITWYNKL